MFTTIMPMTKEEWEVLQEKWQAEHGLRMLLWDLVAPILAKEHGVAWDGKAFSFEEPNETLRYQRASALSGNIVDHGIKVGFRYPTENGVVLSPDFMVSRVFVENDDQNARFVKTIKRSIPIFEGSANLVYQLAKAQEAQDKPIPGVAEVIRQLLE